MKNFVVYGKSRGLIYLENGSLPDLKLPDKYVFEQIHPRISSLISSLFIRSTNKKIIYGRLKKVPKLKKNSLELIIPSRDADRFLEESESLIC